MRTLPIAVSLAALALAASATTQGDHHDAAALQLAKGEQHGEHEHGGHNSHAAPLLEFNETEVLLHHAPDPLSYYAHDVGMTYGADGVSIVPASPDDASRTYPVLITLHVVSMMLAFFIILPLGMSGTDFLCATQLILRARFQFNSRYRAPGSETQVPHRRTGCIPPTHHRGMALQRSILQPHPEPVSFPNFSTILINHMSE